LRASLHKLLLKEFPPNKKIWLVGQARWYQAQKLEYKMELRHQQNPKTSLEGLCWLWNEVKSTVHVNVWTTKASSNTGYCQPRHLPVPEAAI